MKKTYVLTLDDDDSIYPEPNLREKNYDMMPVGKERISS